MADRIDRPARALPRQRYLGWGCAMNRVIEERRLGSLFGDIEYMAEYISVARSTRNATVWLNAKAKIICSGAGIAPDLPPEYLRTHMV